MIGFGNRIAAEGSFSLRRVALLAGLLLTVLGGCYLPARFDAEIEITRNGFYKIIFDGYMVELALYEDIRNKKITPAEEREKVDIIRRDFTRDSATKEFNYIRQGHFKVHWEKLGDLLQDRMITFFRRNEDMLTLKYVKKTGLITMRGHKLPEDDVKRLFGIGLNSEGEIRVKTAAEVSRHNAVKVQKKGFETFYTWQIKSLADPTPVLEIPVR